MQNTWFKCGKIPQNAEGLAGMQFVVFIIFCLAGIKFCLTTSDYDDEMSAHWWRKPEQPDENTDVPKYLTKMSICPLIPRTIWSVQTLNSTMTTTGKYCLVGQTQLNLPYQMMNLSTCQGSPRQSTLYHGPLEPCHNRY